MAVGKIKIKRCPECLKIFTFISSPTNNRRRYCTDECRMAYRTISSKPKIVTMRDFEMNQMFGDK
tara:strand:+ start:1843 stop:2037 length:195 start_codon:yes stop_codon:yes gene_type:complete